MHNRYKYLLALSLCGALALAACGTAQKDWTNASTENTVSGYQAFLDKHPKDEHAQEAQTRIAALQDDAAWKTAQGGNSPDSYQAYLQAEPKWHSRPSGPRRDERGSIGRMRGRRPSRTARRRRCKHSCRNIRRGLKRTRHDRGSPQSSPSYRAELGHYHNERAAQRKRSELQSRFSKVLMEIDVVAPDSANKEFRVMSGLMDRQDANSACTSLKRDHQPCEVVKADQGQG